MCDCIWTDLWVLHDVSNFANTGYNLLHGFLESVRLDERIETLEGHGASAAIPQLDLPNQAVVFRVCGGGCWDVLGSPGCGKCG